MPDVSEKQRERRWGRALTVASLVVLVGATVAFLFPRAGEEDFWFSDASRHALDGLFLVDFVRDGGIFRPSDYALGYMARYPALGLAYYPPLFAVAEAVAYCVAGVGRGVALGTVVCFGLVAVLAAYAHGRAAHGPWLGLVGALLFISMPEVVLWGREVMLELPMTAMAVLVGLFLHLWANEGKRWAAYACAASLVGCVLTKQTGVFMFAVVVLYLVAAGRARLLWSREARIAYAVFAVVLVPYAFFQWRLYGPVVARSATGRGIGRLLDPERWLLFFRALPSMSSGPVVVLAAIGLGASLVRKDRALGRYLLVWSVVGYLFTTYAAPERERYFYPMLPSIALLAAYGAVVAIPARLRGLPVRALVLAAVLGYQGWLGWTVDVPRVSDGYRRAAAFVVSAPRGETVVFHGYHAGNFVYHVRAADAARQMIVVRSDKLFGRVHRMGKAKGTFSPAVETVDEVRGLLREHGVGYVVLEPGDSSPACGLKPLLAAAVAQAPWVLSARVPVASNRAKPGHGDFLIYGNPEAGRATAAALVLWAPLSGRSFEVSYEALRRARGGS